MCLSCNESKGTANGARSHIDSKKRCYACNEIKLLVKEFGTDRTPVTGTLALQGCDAAARTMRRIAKCRRAT